MLWVMAMELAESAEAAGAYRFRNSPNSLGYCKAQYLSSLLSETWHFQLATVCWSHCP